MFSRTISPLRETTTLVMAPNSASSMSGRLDALEVSVFEPGRILEAIPDGAIDADVCEPDQAELIGIEASVMIPAVTRTIGHTYV